jgi:glycosyltransferase involved in cell wall biosynthesis
MRIGGRSIAKFRRATVATDGGRQINGRRQRVVMLLENNPYPQDVRVRLEAQSLTAGGYDVTVLAPRSDGQRRRETVDGVTVRRFGLPAPRPSSAGIVGEYVIANAQLYTRGLAAIVGGADIVHLHNPPDTLFGVAYAARALGRRVVYDMHDIAPELFAAKFGDERVVRVLRWLERRSARSADRLLTVNQSLCDMANERDGVPTERITLVRNAPPSAMLAEATPAREGSLSDPRLVFVGSIESQDGVEVLPELVRVLRDERGLPGVRLTIVGDGGGRRNVEARCRERGVRDSVELTGRVPHERIAGILAHADICLEPAPCNELNHRCSMVKVYEYMAAGRPIVGYPLREVRRLAGDGMLYADGADTTALADPVVHLAHDPGLRRTLGERLRGRARELTWERSAEALLEAYASIAPRGPL